MTVARFLLWAQPRSARNAKLTIFHQRKGRRSNWPIEDNPTSPCACQLQRAARLCSDQRISANKSS